jgi:hypothetical protein
MFIAVLAGNGGRVLIPGAHSMNDTKPDDVEFLDAEGNVIVLFRRQDLILYSQDETWAEIAESSDGDHRANPSG